MDASGAGTTPTMIKIRANQQNSQLFVQFSGLIWHDIYVKTAGAMAVN